MAAKFETFMKHKKLNSHLQKKKEKNQNKYNAKQGIWKG